MNRTQRQTNKVNPLMTAKSSKHHHFVPQGYLRNFYNLHTKILYVLEKQTGKIRESTSRPICAENYYNTLRSDKFPPDSVEKMYAQFESKVLFGLNAAIRSEAAPTSDQWNDILNLASFIFANSPSKRNILISAKQREAEILDDLSKAGIGDFNPEEYFDENSTRIEMISSALNIHDSILPIIGMRNWSILRCSSSGIPFFTSDRPVFLVAKEGRESEYYGIASRMTELLFPLCPTLCIYGSFEDDVESTILASNEMVHSINRCIYNRASRIIISNSRNALLQYVKIRNYRN